MDYKEKYSEKDQDRDREKDQTRSRKKIRLGITLGDIGGIGPELVIRAFQEPSLRELFTPVVYGSSRVLNFYRKALSVEKFSYTPIQLPSQAQFKKVNLIETTTKIDHIEVGMATEIGGQAALDSLDLAIEHINKGELDALVTLPLDKSTVAHFRPDFIGHTDYLANALNAKDYMMFMISDDIKVGLVTGHVPLKDVSAKINTAAILAKLRIMNHSLKLDFTLQKPKIAVLGLNPHAGDHGLLGKEEGAVIVPALQAAEKEGIVALGPYSPDGFFASGAFTRFDGILALYHDQGLIPFKMLAGYSGVNFTAGLPIVRTSPDHGVAYDLAGKNEAVVDSFLNALYSAEDIFRNRTDNAVLMKNSLKNKSIKIDLGEEEGVVTMEE